MSKSNFNIIGVGSPIMDTLAHVDEDFIASISGDKGGMELVSSEEISDLISKLNVKVEDVPGGSAGNTIFALSHLGINTSFLGKLGDDNCGRLYLENFKDANGDTSHFKISKNMSNGRCLSMITPDSQRTMRTDLGAAMTLSPAEITENDFIGFSHAHLEGYLLFNQELMYKILQSAKKAKCKISLDLASFEVVQAIGKDTLTEILKEYIDIVFANEDEAMAFCALSKPELALEKLSECCEIAVVKLGKDGSMLKQAGNTVKVTSKVVDAIDTTGAGDLWAAGFFYGLFNCASLEVSGKLGSYIGSEIVQVMGASLSSKKWAKIKEELSHILE